MDLYYGRGAYSRTRGNLPALTLVNMHLEQTPTDKSGAVLQSRKALVEVAEVGSGPTRAVLQKDGVFGGDRFVVSGTGFYRGSTLLGSISGTGPVSIAASDMEVLVTAGTTLYSYNGTNLVAVTFPDSANVTKIIYTSGYFIALRAGTGTWYFSGVEDGRSWDGLDFATAENEPDALLDALVLDGVIVFFGTESVEFWAPTGDADLPYSPIQQRVFEQGIIGTNCAVQTDNSFYWIGGDKIVYRNGDVPQAVANDGIVEKAAASSSWLLFLVVDERKKFVVLRLDSSTYALDITTGEWCEWKSYGRSNFRAVAGLGDDETGKIWSLSGYVDAGGVMERGFTAGMTLDQPVSVDNLRLTCEVGTTPHLSGDYIAPIIEMRASNDGGNTWSDWEAVSVGEQGQYRERVEWRALGMFDDPGMLFEFRMTDPVSFRLSNVAIQAPGGGRSR